MAKLLAMPERAIVRGFKGVIDFYYWFGIPCARRWPRSPGKRRSPSVEAQWPAFAYAAQAWRTLPEEIRQSYVTMAEGTGISGYHLWMRSYLLGIWPTS